MKIDLSIYGRRVMAGRDFGALVRVLEGLDSLDTIASPENPVQIETGDIFSLNASFLYGLLEGSAMTFGPSKAIRVYQTDRFASTLKYWAKEPR